MQYTILCTFEGIAFFHNISLLANTYCLAHLSDYKHVLVLYKITAKMLRFKHEDMWLIKAFFIFEECTLAKNSKRKTIIIAAFDMKNEIMKFTFYI